MKVTVEHKSGVDTFLCEEGETVLCGGLRAGLTLPYECATGTCGTCRARVMSGDVDVRWKEAPGGKRLKPEKGDILMCQSRPRSECMLRVPSSIDVAPHAPPQLRGAVIRDIRPLTRDVVHFDVHLSAPMKFEAGQFVVVESDDLTGGRAYSMVNFDVEADKIALVLKRKPGGGFSDWLFTEKPGGRPVHVFGPLGRAVFRPAEEKDIVCIAGGSGIAGMMSILTHAVQVNYFLERKGFVFFGVRTLADTFYLNELAAFVAASHGNLEVTVALSDEVVAAESHADLPALKLSSGMVHEVAGAAMRDRLNDVIVYVAGPPVMVDGAIRMLVVNGVPIGDIRYDKFG